MKQDTDCLIEMLRLKKSEALFYNTAADRLEELKKERDEALSMLEHERSISLKIALNADRMHMQLQAIREAALEELCGLTADGPDNLDGLEERE